MRLGDQFLCIKTALFTLSTDCCVVRVVLPPESFLIVLYSSARCKPFFYECVTSDGSIRQNFTLGACHEVVQLSKVCILFLLYCPIVLNGFRHFAKYRITQGALLRDYMCALVCCSTHCLAPAAVRLAPMNWRCLRSTTATNSTRLKQLWRITRRSCKIPISTCTCSY